MRESKTLILDLGGDQNWMEGTRRALRRKRRMEKGETEESLVPEIKALATEAIVPGELSQTTAYLDQGFRRRTKSGSVTETEAVETQSLSSIFRDDKLDPEVRIRLLQIARDFLDSTEIPPEAIIDVRVVGSLAGFFWNESSDLDLHLVVDEELFNDKDVSHETERADNEGSDEVSQDSSID